MSAARLVDMNEDRNVFLAFVCLHDTMKFSRPARGVHLIVDHDTRIVVDDRLALNEAQFVHKVHLVLVYGRLECCNVVLQHVFLDDGEPILFQALWRYVRTLPHDAWRKRPRASLTVTLLPFGNLFDTLGHIRVI